MHENDALGVVLPGGLLGGTIEWRDEVVGVHYGILSMPVGPATWQYRVSYNPQDAIVYVHDVHNRMLPVFRKYYEVATLSVAVPVVSKKGDQK